jgi:hypothetical protein
MVFDDDLARDRVRHVVAAGAVDLGLVENGGIDENTPQVVLLLWTRTACYGIAYAW